MSDANLIQFTVDPEAQIPLFQQIYEELRQRIVSGSLKSQKRLPSSRAFAQELGVSRSSVVTAYDQLIAEGYAESRQGSGVYVSELPDLMVSAESPVSTASSRETVLNDHEVRPFYPGMPDMRLFPYDKWSRCVARVARDYPREIITVQSRFGDIRLREAIASHLAEWRGLSVSPDQIIITAGALGGMELALRVMSRQAPDLYLENPGYKAMKSLAISSGIKPKWLDVDHHGARLPDDIKNNGSGLIILTPSHQYPLGGTMPTARRTGFLNYASETESWILEDDFDSEFRYSGKPIQSLAGMDREGRVFYAGSFSKIFSVGLRLGYLVVPEQTIGLFSGELSRYSKVASVAPQRALAVFMENGEFHKHIRRMRRIYGLRRKLFVSHMDRLSELVSYNDFGAGMQVAVYFNHKTDDVEVSRTLKKAGIDCPPLSHFYSENSKSGLLMGYCSFDESEIERWMLRFGEVIKKA
ncbi:MAG: PLP-dependent aminotransferase family protein [Methyloligellaceae bacterium]